jgi:hypothetical protein
MDLEDWAQIQAIRFRISQGPVTFTQNCFRIPYQTARREIKTSYFSTKDKQKQTDGKHSPSVM